MKLSSYRSAKLATCIAMAAAFLALPQISDAKDKKKTHHSKHQKHHDDYGRGSYYSSRPHSNFVLSFGTGYAGRGYYYGPPHTSYYYQRPGVTYYRTRELAPREYYSREGYGSTSGDAAVQQALARRGYYRGPIDGDIGPGSRRAIAVYQQDRGLRVTGTVTSSLLNSLGLN